MAGNDDVIDFISMQLYRTLEPLISVGAGSLANVVNPSMLSTSAGKM